jgi:hypothetical protein
MKVMENVIEYLKTIRNEEECKLFFFAHAKKFAKDYVEPEFSPLPTVRPRKKEWSDYEHEDESVHDPETSFEMNCYF